MGWIRMALLAGIPLLAAVMGSSSANAAGKSVRVCNMRGSSLYVAIGWFDDGFPLAQGWYVLNINQCKTLSFPAADTILPLFAYAIDAEGREFRPSIAGSNNFCITRGGSFEQKSTALCQVRDQMAKQITSDWESFGGLGLPWADFYSWELR